MVKKMEMKICKKCKVTNPNEAKFCRGCGVNLDASGDLGIWKVVLSIVAVITILIRMMTLMWILRRMIHRKVMILHRHLPLLNPPHLFIGL